MFTCQKCGKKFKDKNALGGHVSSAHAQNKDKAMPAGNNSLAVVVDATEQTEQPQTPSDQPTSPDDEPGIMESIRRLKRRGLSAGQIKDLGYKRQTVDDVFLEEIVPARKPEEGVHGANDEYPVVTRGTEMVTPEGILKRLTNGNPDWALRFEGMMLLRAAQRMNRDDIEMSKMQADSYAAMIRPTLEIMEQNREAQDAAAARARESNLEIAQKAAFEVAQGMGGAFSAEMQDLKAALPGKPDEMDPLTKMFFNAMQPHAQQAIGQLFSGLFKKPGQGGAQPQGGQQPGGTPGQPAQPANSEPLLWVRPEEEDQWTEV